MQVQREEKVSQITNFQKLLAESARFQAWAAGYIQSHPRRNL